MICNIYKCRYNKFHDSKNHICGKCKNKGHGLIGCPLLNMGTTFTRFYTYKYIEDYNGETKLNEETNELLISLIDYRTKLLDIKYGFYFIWNNYNLNGNKIIIRNNNNVYEYIVMPKIYSIETCKELLKLSDSNYYLYFYFTKMFINNYVNKYPYVNYDKIIKDRYYYNLKFNQYY